MDDIDQISDDIRQFLEEVRMDKTSQASDNTDKWAWRLYALLWLSIPVLIVLMIVLPDQ